MANANILVVEDEALVAKDIQNSLKSLGYRVSAVAASGEEAIRKAAETHPDLALMDIVLKGGMDGVEAAVHMRNRFDIPVVYLTAYGDEGTLERVTVTEPFGYILKPFDEWELHRAIKMALYKSQMERRLRENQQRLAVLHEVGLAVTSSLELRTVLDLLLEKIDLVLPYPVASTVRLFNQEREELEPVTCRNLDEEEWKAQERGAGGGLAWAVVERRAPLIVEDVRHDALTRDLAFARRHSLISYLGVPLIAKDEVVGVLGFFAREEHRFGYEEIEFLTALASQGAIAIYNSQLHERVKTQAAEVERASRAKSEFVSMMSHELKTPLNVVLGYAGMIRDEILKDQHQVLGKIIKYSRDLSLMIDSILDAARIEAGAATVLKQETRLGDFLDDLKSLYDFPLGKDITLVWDSPPALPTVKTDSVKLKHILQNLINNSIKFTERGQITVSVRWLPGTRKVEFKVADTGVGIPGENISRIFDIFRQAESAPQPRAGGVGLGLYIVKTFTAMLGGTVEVTSVPGEGSAFTVTIPGGD